MKFKTWDGSDLKGLWHISYKLDGVRAHPKDGKWYSRSGKELYNLPDSTGYGVCEVYLGSWEETVSAVRTKVGKKIKEECLYSLEPIDPKLLCFVDTDIPSDFIKNLYKQAIEVGYEGLVLRQENKFLKVKPFETYDVIVLNEIPGKGKHSGKMGALVTEMGNVGTGFTNSERGQNWVGKTIEVQCMSLTKDGKFRHPRFVRERFDKDGN